MFVQKAATLFTNAMTEPRKLLWHLSTSGAASMTKIVVFLFSAVLTVCTIQAVASQCASITAIAASHTQWTAARALPADPADMTKTCRAYAASFYQVVLTRQAAAICGVGRQRDLALLDSEINAFNDLLANKCGG
jgi:hypothetical protein